MTTQVSTDVKSRLPAPSNLSEQEAGKWRVLCESIFPTAKTPEAILLAMDYCRARSLDIMKKPVHIVPMWSTQLEKYVETVWPSIAEVQITASRTGKYAGMDEPRWGNEITKTFKGKMKNNVGDTEVTLTFPEWCAVTVYRIVDGQRCAFTEPVYWIEAYARIGKTELPNDMWQKRTRGQLLKVAKAFSLRAAFPEEGTYTAEEMEGRVVEETDHAGRMIDVTQQKPKSPFKKAAHRNEFTKNVEEAFTRCITTEELENVMETYKETFEQMEKSDNEYDKFALDSMRQFFKQCWNRIVIATRETVEEDDVSAQSRAMDDEYRNRMGAA